MPSTSTRTSPSVTSAIRGPGRLARQVARRGGPSPISVRSASGAARTSVGGRSTAEGRAARRGRRDRRRPANRRRTTTPPDADQRPHRRQAAERQSGIPQGGGRRRAVPAGTAAFHITADRHRPLRRRPHRRLQRVWSSRAAFGGDRQGAAGRGSQRRVLRWCGSSGSQAGTLAREPRRCCWTR